MPDAPYRLIETILNEIGLGPGASHCTGDESCGVIRRQAVRQLPEAVKALASEGIVVPDETIMSILRQIANHGDPNEATLTSTRAAISTALGYLIDAAALPEADRAAHLTALADHLKENYNTTVGLLAAPITDNRMAFYRYRHPTTPSS